MDRKRSHPITNKDDPTPRGSGKKQGGSGKKQTSDQGQTRDATDTGRTGDKIAVEDPAAAPLHTDAETSGQPTSGPAAMAAREDQERIADEKAASAPAYGSHPQPHTPPQFPKSAWTIGVGIVLLVLVGVVFGAWLA
jgi:hypothetical protein